MEELRQRAPLEGEVKGELDAEDGAPREQRQDLMRWIDHLNDGVTQVAKLLEADGDAVGWLPAEIELEPAPVKLRVPWA